MTSSIHIPSMTKPSHRANDSFRTTAGVIGGIAFGMFLVVSVPAMALATAGTGFGTAVHISFLSNENASEVDKQRWTNSAAIMFALFLACCGLDVGLFKLIKSVK